MNIRDFEAQRWTNHGEYGIMVELIKRLDPPKVFVEIGTESGVECNCRWLAERDWKGKFVEARADCWLHLVAMHKERASRIHCINEKVTVENMRSVLAGTPQEFGLLSIDVDGYDYHLLRVALVNGYRPWIVIIEVNPGKDGEFVMDYDPEWVWDVTTTEYGASAESMAALLERNGYTALGTDSSGVNLFAVRSDLMPRLGE